MADDKTGTSEMLAATFNFAVEVDGIDIAFFREASGLSMEVEVIEHQVVNSKGQQITQKLAGHKQMGEITLKKSMDGTTLWTDWLAEVQSGSWKTYRRNGSIKMFDTTGETVIAQWNFTKGWPKSWSASDLDASADDISTEEVVITHEGLERSK
ncbi:MAG: phage tail protein [Ilumatobacter sp.]